MKFDWYHFILLIFVFFTLKKQKRYFNNSDTDKIHKLLPRIPNIKIHMILICLFPFIMIASKLNSRFFESYVSFIVIIMGYRCFQYILDTSNHVDLFFPSVVLFCVLLLHQKMVSLENVNIIYVYITILGIIRLMTHETSTVQLLNDFVIVHSIFYVLKYS